MSSIIVTKKGTRDHLLKFPPEVGLRALEIGLNAIAEQEGVTLPDMSRPTGGEAEDLFSFGMQPVGIAGLKYYDTRFPNETPWELRVYDVTDETSGGGA